MTNSLVYILYPIVNCVCSTGGVIERGLLIHTFDIMRGLYVAGFHRINYTLSHVINEFVWSRVFDADAQRFEERQLITGIMFLF